MTKEERLSHIVGELNLADYYSAWALTGHRAELDRCRAGEEFYYLGADCQVYKHICDPDVRDVTNILLRSGNCFDIDIWYWRKALLRGTYGKLIEACIADTDPDYIPRM